MLTHPDLVPPDSPKGFSDEEVNVWKTEYDVVSTLRGLGHEVMPLGISNELRPIREAVESFKPHVVFNLLEEFHGEAVYDHSVVSYLELTACLTPDAIRVAWCWRAARTSPRSWCIITACRRRPSWCFPRGERSSGRRGSACR